MIGQGASLTHNSVKLAGEEAKDKMYEPKQNKKLVRVLTVIVYIFSVSLAAIILSLYYLFFWSSGHTSGHSTGCTGIWKYRVSSSTKVNMKPKPNWEFSMIVWKWKKNKKNNTYNNNNVNKYDNVSYFFKIPLIYSIRPSAISQFLNYVWLF